MSPRRKADAVAFLLVAALASGVARSAAEQGGAAAAGRGPLSHSETCPAESGSGQGQAPDACARLLPASNTFQAGVGFQPLCPPAVLPPPGQANAREPRIKRPSGARCHLPSSRLRGAEIELEARQPASPGNGRHGVKPFLRDIGRDFASLPSRQSTWLLAGGIATGIVTSPLDDSLNGRLAGGGSVHRFFLPGKYIGLGPLQAGLAAGLWAYGEAAGHSEPARLGRELLRAHVLTGALTYGVQFAVRRERPDGTDVYAFPSGHTSMTFATAAVVGRRYGWRVAVPMYLLATYVGASRLHENRHHVTDVIAGATLGVIVGRTVTREPAGSWTFTPSPTSGGIAVLVTRANR